MRSWFVSAVALASAVSLAGGAPSQGGQDVLAAPSLVGTITRPNLTPRSVAVYQPANKVFVGDDTTGNVYIYDGATLAELGVVFVGRGLTTMVVDEARGRLYAASLFEKKIGVVDAVQGVFVRYLENPDPVFGFPRYANVFKGHLALDEPLGKLYALALEGLVQIDLATLAETPIPGFGGGGFEGLGVNPVTHEVYVTRYIQDATVVVDGVTLQQTPIPGLGGPGQRVAVNWQRNKAYVGYCGVHANGRSAMCRYDRALNAFTSLAAPNDALNLFYNAASDRTYSTVEVDAVATIVDGASDASVNLPMPGPRTAVAFRGSTGHVYYVGRRDIYVLRESGALMPVVAAVIPVSSVPQTGGVVDQDIAFNHTTGRAYVINDSSVLGFVAVVQDEASGPSPPGPPTGLSAVVSGSSVMLSWLAPGTGSAPTTYVIEAGTAPALADLGSATTGNAVTSFSVGSVPNGTYFVRVRASNAAGVSGPSNEVTIVVGPSAPGPPVGLTANFNATSVALSWGMPASGGTPTTFVIEAGTGPTLADLARFSTGHLGTSFVAGGVPPGTYYVRVRAANSAGTSAPSNEVVLVVAAPSPPLPPSGLTASVVGATVTLSWLAPAGGGAPSTYILDVGTDTGLSNLGSFATGSAATTLNAPGVATGTYYIRVRAANAAGTSGPSNEVVVVVVGGPAAREG